MAIKYTPEQPAQLIKEARGKVVKLLNLSHLDSAYIDREKRTITWPAALMKNNYDLVLPYGPLLHSLLPQGDGLLFTTDAGEGH